MDAVVGYYNAFTEYEANFKGQDAIEWTTDHTEIPVYALAAYLFTVFHLAKSIPNGLKLRKIFAAWNVLLSVFSIIGASRTVPVLVASIYNDGMKSSYCTDPEQWYLNGPSGLWTALFVWSKIPELLDTFFLVFQKKPVIFLHWFHHVTVLLYCWHAFVVRSSTGLWFVSMNYTVHSVMYSYYFFSIAGFKGIARKIAMLITTMQITQMIGGTVVTAMSAYYFYEGGKDECFVDPANFKMGLGMYSSYFCLFAVLFYNKYMKPKDAGSSSSGAAKAAKDSSKDEVCGMDVGRDGAGFFHQKGKPGSSAPPSPTKRGKSE